MQKAKTIKLENLKSILSDLNTRKKFQKKIDFLKKKYPLIFPKMKYSSNLMKLFEYITNQGDPEDKIDYKEELLWTKFKIRRFKRDINLKPGTRHLEEIRQRTKKIRAKTSMKKFYSELNKHSINEMRGERILLKKFMKSKSLDKKFQKVPLEKMVKNHKKKFRNFSTRIKEECLRRFEASREKKKENEKSFDLVKERTKGLLKYVFSKNEFYKKAMENKICAKKYGYLLRQKFKRDASDKVKNIGEDIIRDGYTVDIWRERKYRVSDRVI